MNAVRPLLLSAILLLGSAIGLAIAAPAGAQVTSVAVANQRPAVVAFRQASISGADEPTTTIAAAPDDDGGVSLRGPWTAVSAVVAVVVLLIVARRRLRERERGL